MPEQQKNTEQQGRQRTTMRAVAASRDAAQKHKYALAFWMFAGFALYMTLFVPPV